MEVETTCKNAAVTFPAPRTLTVVVGESALAGTKAEELELQETKVYPGLAVADS